MDKNHIQTTALLDAIPVAAMTYDTKHNIAYSNVQLSDLVGFDPSGMKLEKILGQGSDLLQNARQSTGKNGFFKEAGIYKINGEFVPVRILSIPINALSVGIIVPIGSIRRLETFYLQHMARTPTDYYWILDSSMRILHCDVGKESVLYGLDPLGKSILDIIHPTAIDILKKNLGSLRERPGSMRRFRTNALRQEFVDIEFDAVFVPDSFGSRFYITSRTVKPSGDGVVDRMIEAWMVDTDLELAQALDVSRSTVSRWRAEPSRADTALLQTYRSCGVHVEWLETGRGEKLVII